MATSLPAPQVFQFQGNEIRCCGTDRDPWFIAKDVCDALGIAWRGSDTLHLIPAAWKGVRNLRTQVAERDGTISFRLLDVMVISEAAVYKLAFRSNKPNADAFTNWVASEVVPAIRKAGVYRVKQRERYERLGKSEEWIEERQEGIEERKTLTSTLQSHEAKNFGGATNAIYKPVLGGTATQVKMTMQLPQTAKLRDSLSTRDLARVKFAEMLATEKIESQDLRGDPPCVAACSLAGQAVATAELMMKQTDLSDQRLL